MTAEFGDAFSSEHYYIKSEGPRTLWVENTGGETWMARQREVRGGPDKIAWAGFALDRDAVAASRWLPCASPRWVRRFV